MAQKCKARKRLTLHIRTKVYQKTNGHCAYCGCFLKYKDMRVDHVVAIKRGGKDTINNMLLSCRQCNYCKGTLTLEDFRKRVENFHNVLMRRAHSTRNVAQAGNCTR